MYSQILDLVNTHVKNNPDDDSGLVVAYNPQTNEVAISTGDWVLDAVDQLIEDIETIPGISKVEYDAEWDCNCPTGDETEEDAAQNPWVRIYDPAWDRYVKYSLEYNFPIYNG